MKLYIDSCSNCRNRVYLDVQAIDRNDLRSRLGGENFQVICNICQNRFLSSVTNVHAQGEKTAAVTGGIVGGLIGLVGGPLGLLIAGGIGAAIGNSVDENEQKKVNTFNNSR